MDDAPTKVKSLDEVRTNLAKSYVADSDDLVISYNKEELDFIIQSLTRALEGSSFLGQIRLVDETRTLLQRWDWTDLPSELEGNLKVYVFQRLRLERSKAFTFRRLEVLILNKGEENSLDLEKYVDSRDNPDSNKEELEEDDSGDFTYYVIDYADLSKYELAHVLVSMGNQVDFSLQLREYKEFLVVSDDPELDEASEDSLTAYIEELTEKEGLIDKKYFDANVNL